MRSRILVATGALFFISVFGAFGASAEEIAAVAPSSDSPTKLPSADYKKMRDPFKKPIIHEKEDVVRTELEKIPVSDFTMVGVLAGLQKSRAILRTAAGKVFVVSDGTRIGIHNGYVRKVFADRVIINETLVDVLGDKEVITEEIRLSSRAVPGSAEALVSNQNKEVLPR